MHLHHISTLDADNKNNTLQIVSLQEFVNIQSEEAKKVDAESEGTEAKAMVNLESTVAANEKASADGRNELDVSIVHKIKPTKDKLNGIYGQVQDCCSL